MNRFKFEVSAVDKFSKVFRNLNDQASRSLRPLTNLQRSTGMLFREMHLPAVARGFAITSRAADQLAAGLGRIGSPLTMLTGLGAGGGLLAAAAGVVSLGTAWAGVGAEVRRTSAAIGISTDELQKWRAIGEQAGVSGPDVTTGLSSAAQFAHRAKWGMDQTAVMLAQKLGLNLGPRDQPINATNLMRQLSTAFSRITNAQTRAGVADAMGIGGLLPMLLGGPTQLDALAKKATGLGAVQGGAALQGAQQLEDSLQRFGVAAAGARNRAAGSFGPRLARALDFFADMLSPSQPGPEPSQAEADALRGRFRSFGGGGRGGGAAQLDALASQFFSSNDSAQRADLLERFNNATSKASGVAAVIEVNVNAPPGSTVTATSNSASAPVVVRRAMEGR